MARQAIRHEGDEAESLFLSLVKSARRSDSQKKGDAVVDVDGKSHYVEVKQCTSNTINQVRAIKFIPLVVLAPQLSPQWLVVPPHEIVRLVVSKARGQHTEIPFESANLSLKGIAARFGCEDSDLDDTVTDAIRLSGKYSGVRAELGKLSSVLARLNEDTKTAIRLALNEGDRT